MAGPTKAPFFVQLMGIGALAMILPALVAGANENFDVARPFLYGAVFFTFLAIVLGLATGRYPTSVDSRTYLISLFGAFSLLPLILAAPMAEAVPDTRFLNVYVEMVSSLTTTGATLFEPDRLPLAIHIWRAQVGWMGGLLMLVCAFALLAPMTLGGFEVTSTQEAGRGADQYQSQGNVFPSDRLARYFWRILPIYTAMTALLWLVLIILGDPPGLAAIHAMATMSTSGISSVASFEGNPSGWQGEVLVFVFLVFALTRRTIQGGLTKPLWPLLIRDRELRVAALFLSVVPLFLFLRHWLGAWEVDAELDARALPAFWGGVFMVGSFLTTTGFISGSWDSAQNWSGLSTPGLLLAGLAVMGGGVATTAGGVKLLRVYALYKHGLREMERLVHPSSIAGRGPIARRIRTEGASIAWVFFMLFAMSIAVVMVLLAMTGLTFEETVILSVAALSTTGPIASIATETPISYADLPDASKLILSGAMVLGRFETLAVIALLNPNYWRS